MTAKIGDKVLFGGAQYNIVSENNGIMTAEATADETGLIPTIKGNSEYFNNLMII